MDLIKSQVVIYSDDSFRYEGHFFGSPIGKLVYKGFFARDFSCFGQWHQWNRYSNPGDAQSLWESPLRLSIRFL